ncbi:MAG TPA: DEAD/DEAH box helicase, partial [Gemmatimonadales bacterium]|nr:DEAD/DEAH box helicase [Gemmatimonadales bacterium]
MSALARAALPPEADVPAPPSLLPHQVRAFRRAVGTVRMYGAVLLADPVGTGKTWVALAAAKVLCGSALCIVPAVLRRQWQEVAARLGVPMSITSHEQVSRGYLPKGAGTVIVDESHHFRNPGTLRYNHLARWLGRRQTLLVSATPAVNRLADLQAQLALVFPDDVLAPLGVPSLRAMPPSGSLPATISLLIHVSPAEDARPEARRSAMISTEPDPVLLAAIDGLELSRSRPVARLIRGVLWRALASSPAAVAAALRRYRLLLLQAADAAAVGVRPARASLRQWAGALAEQTVLWALLDEIDDTDLVLDELPAVEAAIALADRAARQADPKAERLVALLKDARRTLVFTSFRDTALWLRQWIRPVPSWCTGDAAGIGHTRMAREAVLSAFGPAAESNGSPRPRVLIATDVAAEGLDLQGAGRVVHYDLPWTPARLDQREGRARRLGALHDTVHVTHFEPAPMLELRLGQQQILETKKKLPARAGLIGESLERLRKQLETVSAAAPGNGIISIGQGSVEGVLAAIALVEVRERARIRGSILFWLPVSGVPDASAGTIASALGVAAGVAVSAHAGTP